MALKLALSARHLDVLDRVLDKGIVIDAWYRLCPLGIDVRMTIEACAVVTSIDTYLRHIELSGAHAMVGRPSPLQKKQRSFGLEPVQY
jgi:gas vesicle structural protein